MIVDVVMSDMDGDECGGGRQGQVPGTFRALSPDFIYCTYRQLYIIVFFLFNKPFASLLLPLG